MMKTIKIFLAAMICAVTAHASAPLALTDTSVTIANSMQPLIQDVTTHILHATKSFGRLIVANKESVAAATVLGALTGNVLAQNRLPVFVRHKITFVKIKRI